MRSAQTALAAVSLAVLQACGGGGADTPTAPAATFPVEAVYATLATTSASYSASYTDATGVYTLGLVLTPGPSKKFTASSAASPTFMATATLRKNGGFASSSSSETFFTLSPATVVGEIEGTDYIEIKTRTLLPATATVGASGPFYTSVIHIGNTVLTSGDQVVTWSLEADTQSTAFLCLNTFTLPANIAESSCFKIDTAGKIFGFKATATLSGSTVKFL